MNLMRRVPEWSRGLLLFLNRFEGEGRKLTYSPSSMPAGETETLSEFRAFVANCLMGGADLSETSEGSSRNLVVFECAGRKFLVRQKREVIIGDLTLLIGKSIETTEVIVPGVVECNLKLTPLKE